jgi:hypothetical protein
MTDLSTLAGGSENAPKLEDLVTPVDASQKPLLNKSTQQNLAAHAALLTGGDQSYATYDKMMTEFNTGGASQTYDQINLEANKLTNDSLKKTMVDVAGNPDVPSDARAQIVASWQERNPAAEERDPAELLAVSSLAKDGKTIGDHQIDTTRELLIPHLKSINNYNTEVQKMINGQAVVNDAGIRESVLNFTEMLLPFLEPAAVAKVNLKLRKAIGDDDAGGVAAGLIESMALLGESKMNIKGVLESIPIEKRLPMAQTIYTIVTEGQGTIIPGGKNSMMMMNQLRDFLEEGHYTLGDRILDDIGSVADVVGLGGLVRSTKGVKAATKVEAAARTARATGHSPMSVASTLANTNDKSFEEVLKLADQDKTGGVAEALFHSSRDDAIANGLGPEIGLPDGSVRYKPKVESDHFNPDTKAVEQITSGRGNIEFTKAEKDVKLATIKTDIQNLPHNMTVRTEMTTVEAVDGGVNIRTIIGPNEGGFTDPVAALENTKLAMAKYGVHDEELTLLKRGEDGTYQKVDAKSISTPKPQEPTIRLYRGEGAPDEAKKFTKGSAASGRYFSSDVKDAEKFAKKNKGKVVYIDVPKSRYNELVSDAQKPDKWFIVSEKLASEKLYINAKKKAPPTELPKGDYVVGVNHTSKYDPSDPLATMSEVTTNAKLFGVVPLNIFDKARRIIKGKAGSITQHIFPPSSVIDPTLVNAAVVTADYVPRNFDILLEGPAGKFVDQFTALSTEAQGKMEAYFIEANANGLKFDPVKLAADGFNEAEIATAKAWKEMNDTLYVLENVDLIRKSKQKGFQVFVSTSDNTTHIVKPLARNTAGSVTSVYDPSIGKIRAIEKEELTKLYESGGNISVGRTPFEIDGDAVRHVLVEQNAAHYNRALREEFDTMLNYREGHFTIYYKDPIFVRQHVKDVDGVEYEKAVATAGDIKTARAAHEELKRKFPDNKYSITEDRLTMDQQDELMWNAKVYSGRTSQRTRGETLADLSGQPADHGFQHIESPVESLNRSMRSISNRIPMQQYLDVAKKRYMQQFNEYLPSKNGVKGWPNSIDDLVKPGLEKDQSAFHAAITNYRFIDAQENGFINMLDDASKNFFKSLADTAGTKGWGWAERVLRKGQNFGPTNFSRKSVFKLTLASSPGRQAFVQAMQAVPVVLATNPAYIAKIPFHLSLLRYFDRGGDALDADRMLSKAVTGLDADEIEAMRKAWLDSGMQSSVEAHSMRREDMKSLVTQGLVNKGLAIAGKPLDIAQKYGFDLGENTLMKVVWLSEYDVAKKAGKAKTAEDLANIHVRARALTGNMNKGDELAYNSNMFGTVMQFAQAPHKIFSQVLIGNRQLTKVDRLKLGTSYMLLYGTGYGVVYDQIMKALPSDNKELQDAIAGGFFNYSMNQVLSAFGGDEVKADWSSSLRLLDIPNFGDYVSAVGTLSLGEILKNNPTGQMLGEGGKINNLVRSIQSLYQAPDMKMTKDVVIAFGDMFSGVSSFMKGKIAWDYHHTTTQKGEIIDPDVNHTEAVIKGVLGIGTIYESRKRATDDATYKASGKAAKDVKYINDEIARRMNREGISETDINYLMSIRAAAMKQFGNDPYYAQLIDQDIRKRIKTGDDPMINNVLKLATTSPASDIEKIMAKSNMTQDQIENARSIMRAMKEKY